MTQADSQTQAIATTRQLLNQAEAAFRLTPLRPEIRFDLSGKTAGSVSFGPRGRIVIRYNAILLAQYGQHFIDETVPHEVAHIVARSRYGPRIKPHGSEWKRVMAFFRAPARRCHSFDTTRAVRRRMRYFDYQCACRTHRLSAVRHNRIRSGAMTYQCRLCGSPLQACNPASDLTDA
ncbi:MAG: SprT-like domain-containing protein [Candidatus Thiodiazotropha sp.]